MDQNLVDEQEVSPASIITKTLITWDLDKIASNVEIEDSKATFTTPSGFRFVKSKEEFDNGRHTFNILFNRGKVHDVGSIGINWNKEVNMNPGGYANDKSMCYANYWPAITNCNDRFTIDNLPKYKDGDIIGIIIDFNISTLEFFLNESSVFTTTLVNEGNPVFVYAGLFDGTLEIIQ